jgi:hypothetical protein
MGGLRKGVRHAVWGAACLLGLLACGDPIPSQQASATGALCLNNFQTCVMPVLSGQIRRRGGSIVSCMDSNCHVVGGSGGRLLLVADTTANSEAIKANFVNFQTVDESLILAEPLQDDQTPAAIAGVASFHGGGEIFPNRSTDPCYLAVSNWIGEQVTSQSTCSVCTAITNTLTSCGY